MSIPITLTNCSGDTFTGVGAYGKYVAYDNDSKIWIAVGYDSVKGSIKYSMSPSTSGWTSVPGTNNFGQLTTVACGKDPTGKPLWVAAGVNSANTAGVMYYSTSPTSQWTEVTRHPFAKTGAAWWYTSICYDGTYFDDGGQLWLVGGFTPSSLTGKTIAYTFDLSIPLPTWNICSGFMSSNGVVSTSLSPFNKSGVCYGIASSGYYTFVACGQDRSSTGFTGNNIYYSDDPTNPDPNAPTYWTVVPGSPFGSGSTNICRGVGFFVGTWLAWGSGGTTDTTYTVMYATAQNYKSAWTPIRYDPFPGGVCHGITLDITNNIFYAIGAPVNSSEIHTVRYTGALTGDNPVDWIDVPGESFGSAGRLNANSSGASIFYDTVGIGAIGADDNSNPNIKYGLFPTLPLTTLPLTTPPPTTPPPTTPPPTTPPPTTPPPKTPKPQNPKTPQTRT